MYWFKRKWRQIKRTVDFLPIIWRGYDWDYRYAIELFQHQLKRTADCIEESGMHLNKDNDVSRIRTAVELMEKVYEEEYGYEYAAKMEELYGPSKLEFIETKELDSNGDPYYTLEEFFERDYTDDELLIIAEEKRNMILDSRAKQKRAHKVLWNFIEHNIQNWWD